MEEAKLKCSNRIRELHEIIRNNFSLKSCKIICAKSINFENPNFRVGIPPNYFLNNYNISEVSISISPNIKGNRPKDLVNGIQPSTIEIALFDDDDNIVKNTDSLGFPKGDFIKRFSNWNYNGLINFLVKLSQGPYPLDNASYL